MGNLLFKKVHFEKTSTGEYYEQFVLNSLKIGQGITIGNQLRRVLLNDVAGIAISEVNIIGVNHEYSVIPGVREDILEILLNLKGIICKSDLKENQVGRLKVKGPAVITADMIQVPSSLEIINSTHYIATISNSVVLEIEFKFEYGTGYKLAYQTFSNERNNHLQLDAIFMPVKKVEYKIENVYDFNNNIEERLYFEIWTNGSILPFEAVKLAIDIVIETFTNLDLTNDIEENTENIFERKKSEYLLKELNEKNRLLELDLEQNITNKNRANKKKLKKAKLKKNRINNDFYLTPETKFFYSETIEPYLNLSIEELQLSVRPYNCLKTANIQTIGDLLKYSPEQLLKLRNFGKKSAEEVFSILKNRFGIILK